MINKTQNSKLEILILIIFVCLGFSVFDLGFISKIHAQSPSPTGTTVRDNIKQQVAQELSQIKQSVSKKAFLGTIATKSDTGITLTTHLNQTKNVTVTTDTTIRLAGSKEGTLADLKANDYVLVMGNVDGAGVMTAVRLLIVPKPGTDTRKTVFAKVTKVTTSTLTVESPDKQTWSVKLSSAVKYNGKTKATDIKVDSNIVVLGTVSSTTITAKHIVLLPSSQ
ncbi:MAG: hypothetical protein AAB909_00355 [Patescibacteria group bacterium]